MEIKITKKGLNFVEMVDEKQITGKLFKQSLSSKKVKALSESLDEFRSNMEENREEM